MTEVLVTGIGLVSSLSNHLNQTWQKLITGKSGIQFHQPFPELSPLPLGLINLQPTGLNELTQLVVASALKDSGLISPLPDCGVVIGSSRGYQATWESYGKRELKKEFKLAALKQFPSYLGNWLDSLPHMNAITVARNIGATGVVMSPMTACATGLWCIIHAMNLIQSGQCQRVIAGAVEAPITPLTIAGFQQMGALAKTGSYPFDKYREGLVLGEGGAVFVLESGELARERKAKIYGQILGGGMTADAYHGNAPDPQGKSALAAVQQCLQRSYLKPEEIDFIHAHGTATQLNDRIESLVIQNIFSNRVAVSSTKGATGHTLGASGALGIAFSLMALQQQILPPCVGLKEPEFDLNLASAARHAEVKNVLCLSFGFGGQNTAIALGKM
ncbi:MAG: beta-ketoacyl-ACP synthase [Richelia sp.]|nr:beta-ketoacyl-ACP synthase [Richelia sp.]